MALFNWYVYLMFLLFAIIYTYNLIYISIWLNFYLTDYFLRRSCTDYKQNTKILFKP
jgi:hypothetical protein